jgi:hypothetical protein
MKLRTSREPVYKHVAKAVADRAMLRHTTQVVARCELRRVAPTSETLETAS